MKPSAFEYIAPATLREAVSLLAADPDATVIAGGQSLMPLLAFRLTAPSLLVDLRRIPGLDAVVIDDAGVRLGAQVRWRDIEDDARLVAAHPLLREAISHVAHYAIRNRGTVGGSLAHADPAAELPGIAVACDADIVLVGANDERVVAAGEFFTGPLSTVRRPEEIVTELRLPPWPASRRWAFREFAQRKGDFALAGIALFYDQDANDRIENAHVGVIGACDRPHRLPEVEAMLNGRAIGDELIRAAAALAAKAIDPPEDLHADAAYRRGLVRTLVERALRAAQTRGV
ncbi:MAG TPA: xanthine dehydrogenase family protein subunit M [Stellaceae bacterium]|nr:xanthine dehydrogenase family protein subunit M [Stellaceae bacterium]